MKTAVIDVGGGMRDVYGSGVFDFCLDNGIGFDYCIGISAGSANISSYLAGQRGRSRRFYDVYSFRKEYMGVETFLSQRSYVDLDYAYGTAFVLMLLLLIIQLICKFVTYMRKGN